MEVLQCVEALVASAKRISWLHCSIKFSIETNGQYSWMKCTRRARNVVFDCNKKRSGRQFSLCMPNQSYGILRFFTWSQLVENLGIFLLHPQLLGRASVSKNLWLVAGGIKIAVQGARVLWQTDHPLKIHVQWVHSLTTSLFHSKSWLGARSRKPMVRYLRSYYVLPKCPSVLILHLLVGIQYNSSRGPNFVYTTYHIPLINPGSFLTTTVAWGTGCTL